jgi:hypothetical protein
MFQEAQDTISEKMNALYETSSTDNTITYIPADKQGTFDLYLKEFNDIEEIKNKTQSEVDATYARKAADDKKKEELEREREQKQHEENMREHTEYKERRKEEIERDLIRANQYIQQTNERLNQIPQELDELVKKLDATPTTNPEERRNI